jgi:hypothetical protein
LARRKREASTFNLSFLDIMSCGFGAVVLVFLIIDHSMEQESEAINAVALAEIDLLDDDIEEGKKDLVRLRNAITSVDKEIDIAEGLAKQVTDDISTYEASSESLTLQGLNEKLGTEALELEKKQLEERVENLQEAEKAQAGRSARDFTGDGNRQYLTGLKLGGARIAILVDISASMLATTVPEIIFMRYQPAEVQRASRKWQQAIRTVEWLTSQLPVSSKYQLLGFNTEVSYFKNDVSNKWLETSDRNTLDTVVGNLKQTLPSGGTNMSKVFQALNNLPYGPDNIFLITDGLPTQGIATNATLGRVTPESREKNFKAARKLTPSGVPINTILLPMAGDPSAAWEFWQLAQRSNGALITPAADWP